MNTHKSIWSDWLGVSLKQYYVNAGGVRTRVVEAGEGPPLLLVHGTGGHVEAYTRNLKGLSQHFRTIVYDMLGHGLTDSPDMPYTTDVLSNHQVALLDALGIEKAHLSGESLGGWVVAWTAAHHPERVDRLLLNTPGNVTSKPETLRVVRDSTLQAVRDPTTANVRARLEFLFYDKSLVTDELVAIRQAIYSQVGFLKAIENTLVLQDPAIRKRYIWNPEWCGRITAPTLLVWTDHDPTGGLDEADLLLKWIPGSQLRVIYGAGHWPQWEKPEEFDEIHRTFLANN